MRTAVALTLTILMLATLPLAGCGPGQSTTGAPDAEPADPAEQQVPPVEESTEEPFDEPWTAPDPVPQAVGLLASASGFDPAVLSGEAAALAERADQAWARVMVSHSDPGYETESVHLTIARGDAEWTLIDYGTGLGPADLEAQGVPAEVAAEIAAF